jgi:hypothetical protein
MEALAYDAKTREYAKCIEGSKRIRWDIDADVLRGRHFDFSQKFLPDGLSRVDRLEFLDGEEKTILSQVQGRTYANMFGFVERFIVAKVLDISRDHCLGDQIALEALIRFCDEELKHQELFRRIEMMMAVGMAPGYTFPWDPNQVAGAVLEKSTWAVMGLIYEIELFTQEHYKKSIEPDEELSPLYKDVFLFHWKEEAHHAYLDALEWERLDSRIPPLEREKAIGEVIELVGAVDGILQAQSRHDTEYFLTRMCRELRAEEQGRIRDHLLQAYRWQYIFSGLEHPRFQKLFRDITTEEQRQRVDQALSTLR